MLNLFMIIVGLSGGLAIGAALAAFVSLLEIVPRLVHITKTKEYIRLYQWTYILGVIVFNIFFFCDINFKFNKLGVVVIGLILGTYTGIFSSALAEVLNVVPVMSKKLKLKKQSKLIIYALLFGKVAGSLYYWLVFK